MNLFAKYVAVFGILLSPTLLLAQGISIVQNPGGGTPTSPVAPTPTPTPTPPPLQPNANNNCNSVSVTVYDKNGVTLDHQVGGRSVTTPFWRYQLYDTLQTGLSPIGSIVVELGMDRIVSGTDSIPSTAISYNANGVQTSPVFYTNAFERSEWTSMVENARGPIKHVGFVVGVNSLGHQIVLFQNYDLNTWSNNSVDVTNLVLTGAPSKITITYGTPRTTTIDRYGRIVTSGGDTCAVNLAIFDNYRTAF